ASGVGKSSLLRSRVIPSVREQDALPIYFEEWTRPDPLLAFKQACFSALAGSDCAARRPLSDISMASLIQEGSARADLVLILDQFEGFLIRHARNLEPLQSELGTLIRTCGGVHILISLREEFLAGLNAFRMHIPSIYQSTYRLERLRDAAAK